MNIALISLGRMSIPHQHMGSIENILWQYKHYLGKVGHTVDIYNSLWIHEVIHEINKKKYDFIHLHSDLHSLAFNTHLKQKYCLTSHCGGFSKFIPGKDTYYPAFNYLYEDSLEAPGNIVLSKEIEKLYKQSGYTKFLKVLRNPVETEKFFFNKKGNGKAICVGRIISRKQQALLANLLKDKIRIDFIGPYDSIEEPNFKENNSCRYLGSWDKQTLYKQLTEYSCLVLLSKSEADPLVVKEALAAGLSVVVSESCSANLTDEQFITILPDEEKNSDVIAQAIEQAIDKNDSFRDAIRTYAYKRFDYSVVVNEYLQIINGFKSYYQY